MSVSDVEIKTEASEETELRAQLRLNFLKTLTLLEGQVNSLSRFLTILN